MLMLLGSFSLTKMNSVVNAAGDNRLYVNNCTNDATPIS